MEGLINIMWSRRREKNKRTSSLPVQQEGGRVPAGPRAVLTPRVALLLVLLVLVLLHLLLLLLFVFLSFFFFSSSSSCFSFVGVQSVHQEGVSTTC